MRHQWFSLQRSLFFAIALVMVVPLWVGDYPPIQDFPQHAAAIRVLTDFSDPALRFSEYFELSLGQTQYLAYYGVAVILAKVFGVIVGQRLLLSLALIGIAVSVRTLLRTLNRDPGSPDPDSTTASGSLAFLVFPLLWNAHTVLGFVNFIAAIPLAFYGLALAARLRLGAAGDHSRALGSVWSAGLLGAVAFVAYFTHVVPWAFLNVGASLLAFGGGARATVWRVAPLAPSLIAAAIWLFVSPAGRSVLGAAGLDRESQTTARFQSPLEVIESAPDWLTNVLPGAMDDWVIVAWVFLVVACIALGVGSGERARGVAWALRRSLRARLALLVPLAVVAAFVTPTSYQWIWPINGRFPLLALLFLVPVLPVPRRRFRQAIVGAAGLLGVVSAVQVSIAFRGYARDELGPLDAAIDVIPPGKRVAGLIFDLRSRHVRFAPLMHSVAWYQARKGGAVMFTFADFPHSPFRFLEESRPPIVPPRWEWTPWAAVPNPALNWYDFVLVRGGPGRIAAPDSGFERIFEQERWTVWRRVADAPGDDQRDEKAP